MNIEEYSKIAPQYYTDEVPPLLLQLLNFYDFHSVLDCGCGDGSLLHALDKRGYLKGKIVYAVDFSKTRIALVKKLNPKFKASVGSAEDLRTTKSNTIDLFISTQVIEHVDDKKMVETIHRVVKKGGRVFLSTVFKKSYAWYFYHNQIGWVLDPTHLREYQKDSQLFRLFKGKFKVIISAKRLQWFPIIDFFAKRFIKLNRNRDTFTWKLARSIRIPVLGYYNWEMVLMRI